MKSHIEANQDKVETLQNIMDAVRQELTPYMDLRKTSLNARQIFELMMAMPVALAVALDEKIDSIEKNIIGHTSNFASQYFSQHLSAKTRILFSQLIEPEEIPSPRFRVPLEEEIHYIIENQASCQEVLVRALKEFLAIEPLLKKDNEFLKPIKDTLIETMHIIVFRNEGDDQLENERLQQIMNKLGIEVSQEYVGKIIASLQ